MAQKVGKTLSRLGNRNLIVFILFGIKETNEVENEGLKAKDKRQKKLINKKNNKLKIKKGNKL